MISLLTGVAACGGDSGGPLFPPPPQRPGPASSPPAASPGPGQHELTLDHGGVTREYRLHAPAGYAPGTPVPLVIALHPYPSTGWEMSQLTGLDEVAARENVLVAYPDGIGGGFNALVCCGSADDVGFLTALTDRLVETWRVDPDRVYLTGISNGGDLSFRAAVEASDRFAAIGVVSGGFIGERVAAVDYAPKQPVSVITFIGGHDRYAEQFRTGVVAWQDRLRCTSATPSPAPPAAGSTLTRARCADGSDVEVYVIEDMGHSWPGAPDGAMAAPDVGVVATELIWKFFAAHSRQH